VCFWKFYKNYLLFYVCYTLTDHAVFHTTFSSQTKMKRIEDALIKLRRDEPNMRAVIFTHMRQVFNHLLDMVKRLGMELYAFSGQTSARGKCNHIALDLTHVR
jgi:ERCC4-related helicase